MFKIIVLSLKHAQNKKYSHVYRIRDSFPNLFLDTRYEESYH